jgi:hypothetical protein
LTVRWRRPARTSIGSTLEHIDARVEAQLAEPGTRFGHNELHRRTGRGPSLMQSFSKILSLGAEPPRHRQERYKLIDATVSWSGG